MRVFLYGGLAALVIAGPALAAPPPLPQPISWSGFYLGLNAGYGFGSSSDVTVSAVPSVTIQSATGTVTTTGIAAANSGVPNVAQRGFLGGGQIGYNHLWRPNVVVGIEADLQGAAIRGSGSYSGIGVDTNGNFFVPGVFSPVGILTTTGFGTVTARVNWLGTLRGRIGYLIMPTMLLYATGGLSIGGVEASLTTAASTSAVTDPNAPIFIPRGFQGTIVGAGVPGNASATRAGWNIGGGTEWMFSPSWSVKAEAFYYNLGSQTVTAKLSGSGVLFSTPFTASETSTARVRYDGVVARLGVNFHLN